MDMIPKNYLLSTLTSQIQPNQDAARETKCSLNQQKFNLNDAHE